MDKNSGIRERLALIAMKGPERRLFGGLNPKWRYDSHHDAWKWAGDHGVSSCIYVSQEASASLADIKRYWKIDRAEAMALIGYPERR